MSISYRVLPAMRYNIYTSNSLLILKRHATHTHSKPPDIDVTFHDELNVM